MTNGALGAWRRREPELVALALAAAWALLLAWLLRDIVAGFFPYAEEWKVMAPSLPGLAEPLAWLTRGFGDYHSPYQAFTVAAINFVRPVFNAIYWLRGALFGEFWGGYLYVNFLAIGACAGVSYLAMRRMVSAPRGLALALAATLPLLPPFFAAASRFQAAMLPQMTFDPLLAALCLLAVIAYAAGRYGGAAVLLLVALLTKEQCLPVAAALPLVHAWRHRRRPGDAWRQIAILALPLVAWIVLRLLVFGAISGGAYVMMREPVAIARAFVAGLVKLPLYAPSPLTPVREPFSIAAVLVVCNAAVLGYLALSFAIRWRRDGPDALDAAIVLAYGFLALVGLNPRYGAVLLTLVVVALARAAPVRGLRPLRILAIVAILLTSALHGWRSMSAFPAHEAMAQRVYDVGRAYASALAAVGDAPVLVLNDPNTMYTHPKDMAAVLGLAASPVKASDFPWRWPAPYATEASATDCSARARRESSDSLVMTQDCGFQLLGAAGLPDSGKVAMPIPGTASVRFPEARRDRGGVFGGLGERMHVHLERPGVRVLYYDPAGRRFQWVGGMGAKDD